MKNIFITLLIFCSIVTSLDAQINTAKFGKGIRFMGEDSTFSMKLNFRIQNLMVHEWEVADGSFENYESSFMIRRSRIKMGGWAMTPRLKYKFEMGLSSRDVGGGNSPEFNNTARLILDAWLSYDLTKSLTVKFGQGKLPGNRERVISSANLQFVDRSRLNSRFNLDRDVGIHLINKHTLGRQFKLKETFAWTQGEGRNVTAGHFGGYDYTFRVEAWPFGSFESKGDYVASAIFKEATPKLAVGLTYDINQNAVRERAQGGSFITYEGDYFGKTLNTFFVDMMFKYQRWSVMSEFVDRKTSDNISEVFAPDNEQEIIGTFYTGTGFNLQLGYMFVGEWELAGRVTTIDADEGVAPDEKQYTFGLSKFFAGHNLKLQTDFTYRSIEDRNNNVFWRTQVEFQF